MNATKLTKEQKKARNMEAARARLEDLQLQQRAENERRKRRAENKQKLLDRATAAHCSRQYFLWLEFTGRKNTAGAAALFFAENPDLKTPRVVTAA